MLSILLEIITPEKVAYSGQVEMISAPSASGILGILPHHIPLFTKLIEGEVKIIKDNQEIYLAIGGGFMEVTSQKVIILVTEAYHASELKEQEILIAKKNAEEALKNKPTGIALIEAQTLFKRSLIALKVLHRRKNILKV